MKKTLFFGLSLALLPCYLLAKSAITFEAEVSNSLPEHRNYILKFQFPPSIKKIPQLCGYYKGYRLSFNSDLCVLQESPLCSTFTLVIVEDIHQKGAGNKILNLEDGSKCRMFSITKNIGGDEFAWSIEEEARDNIPNSLPKDSIILLFNPDLIDKIDVVSDGTTSSHEAILHLPRIEIKPDITQNELDTTCTAAWCAAIGIRGIHRSLEQKTKNETLRSIKYFPSSTHKPFF